MTILEDKLREKVHLVNFPNLVIRQKRKTFETKEQDNTHCSTQ